MLVQYCVKLRYKFKEVQYKVSSFKSRDRHVIWPDSLDAEVVF